MRPKLKGAEHIMDYFSVGYEARSMYEEKLRNAEEHRRAKHFVAHNAQTRPGLLVRAGEAMVALGERLKRQGKPTYAYGER